MIKKLAKIIGLLLLTAGAARAAAVIEREMACPVCGHEFYAKLDSSAQQADMRLDLKPVGPEAAPFLLPDCPKCGFVVYKIPIPRAELAKCRAVVASPEYQKSLKRSSYYRAGLLYENLGKADFSIANTYLKASWQEEADAARLKEDLEASLRYFKARAANEADKSEEWENSKLLIGELLRRLGRFGEAKIHLEGLRNLKAFQKNFFGDIVDYELALCDKWDAGPHDMQEVREFKKPPLLRAWEKFKAFAADLTALPPRKTE
jgi:uncharacterized protein (DUF2225 family)